jgi:hypothetical protein
MNADTMHKRMLREVHKYVDKELNVITHYNYIHHTQGIIGAIHVKGVCFKLLYCTECPYYVQGSSSKDINSDCHKEFYNYMKGRLNGKIIR